jgi:release factor glutamine methyltransferase
MPVAAGPRLDGLVARRARREPVFQVIGRREFWSLELRVDCRVLCPRPETELVVETALAVAPTARRVLDCGTGSGAIAAALSRELPTARVAASDRSAEALAVAAENLARLAPRVRVVRADWLTAFRPRAFDLVAANPPYVERATLAALAPEVCEFEPPDALDGGPDGLAALRVLLATAPRVLDDGGWLVVEVGAGQAPPVVRLAENGAWSTSQVRRDAAGIERVVALRRRDGERGDG